MTVALLPEKVAVSVAAVADVLFASYLGRLLASGCYRNEDRIGEVTRPREVPTGITRVMLSGH